MTYIIVGKTCAGKSSMLNIIKKSVNDSNTSIYEASDIYKELNLTQKKILCSPDAIAKHICRVEGRKDNVVVISGFRLLKEILYIKSNYDKELVFIIVKSNRLNRYIKYKKRTNTHSIKTFCSYFLKSTKDFKLGVNELIDYIYKYEKYVIVQNDGKLAEFTTNVENVIIPLITGNGLVRYKDKTMIGDNFEKEN